VLIDHGAASASSRVRDNYVDALLLEVSPLARVGSHTAAAAATLVPSVAADGRIPSRSLPSPPGDRFILRALTYTRERAHAHTESARLTTSEGPRERDEREEGGGARRPETSCFPPLNYRLIESLMR
jgi:hypothetical protein